MAQKILPGTGGEHYIPYEERTGEESVVYFTRDLSPEGLRKIYERVNEKIEGKIGIKLHTGEKNGPNIIPHTWVKELVEKDLSDAAIVETNTYYEGDRYTTEQHRETLKVNGWTFCPVDILDENGTPQYTELMTANPDGDTFKTCQLLYTMVMVPTVVDTRASFGLYSDAQLAAQEIWSSNIDDAYVLPEITMTEDENNELSSIYSDLSTMVSEKLIKFIIGDEPMDNWSSFVADMEDMNAQRCVEIYQDALDRYLAR